MYVPNDRYLTVVGGPKSRKEARVRIRSVSDLGRKMGQHTYDALVMSSNSLMLASSFLSTMSSGVGSRTLVLGGGEDEEDGLLLLCWI